MHLWSGFVVVLALASRVSGAPRQTSKAPKTAKAEVASAQELFDEARRATDLDARAKLGAKLDRLLAKAPHDAVALHARGWLELQGGSAAAAAELLDQAVAAAPGDPSTLIDSGLAYRKLGKHPLASERFGRALALTPEAYDANYEAAVELYWIGAHDQALARFAKASALAPDRYEPRAGIVQCNRSLGKHAAAEVARTAMLAAWKRAVGDDSGILVERMYVQHRQVEVLEFPASGILNFVVELAGDPIILTVRPDPDARTLVVDLFKHRAKRRVPAPWKGTPAYPELRAAIVAMLDEQMTH